MTESKLAAVAALVVACVAPSSSIPDPTLSIETVGLVDVVDVAWTSEGLLAVVPDPDQPELRTTLVVVSPDGERVEPLPTDRGACESLDFYAPWSFDGRLIFSRACYPGGQISLRSRGSVDGEERVLVENVGFPPNAVTSTDDGSTWIASDSSGFCAWVSRISGSGGPWPILIADGPRPFHVDEGLLASECDHTGLASHVAVAPDGRLAFLAAPESTLLAGQARLEARWNLYTVDKAGTVTTVATDFVRPTGLEWAPIDRVWTVSAIRGSREAIWSVSDSGVSEALFDGNIIAFSWSPEGSELAVVIVSSGDLGRTQLLRLSPPGEVRR